MTLYVQTLPGKPSVPDTTRDFVPWINVQKPEEIVGLASNRHIRERGGIAPGEFYEFTVFHFSDAIPRHPNGRPKIVQKVVMTADRRGES